ncbi:MAG: class I SAM-dependent methyltransferase [Candidatus Limnocylindria bacterium]
MTQQPSSTAAARFSDTAAAYAATMAPSIRPIAAEVVRRAQLRPRDRVIDIGTGTGHAAAMALGAGRSVVGIDAAPGMLDIARRAVAGVDFREMDFGAVAADDGSFDVAISVHALLFATDQGAILSEWRRLVAPGGRMSLSVPGPDAVTPSAIYAEIYDRHGIDTSGRYPTTESLAELVSGAGWTDVTADADPTTAIVLGDEDAFRTWREIGSRGAATAAFTPEHHRALTEEMLAATPRTPNGGLSIPFGALYVTARR